MQEIMSEKVKETNQVEGNFVQRYYDALSRLCRSCFTLIINMYSRQCTLMTSDALFSNPNPPCIGYDGLVLP